MAVIALVTDLFFATKIRSTGQAVGVPVQFVRSAADLLSASDDASMVLIDVNASGVDSVEAIAQVRQQRPGARILAFLSHVQTDLAAAARKAGADEVMPRSRFSAELPQLLRNHS